MIVLSYLTKKFFEELIEKPLEEKKYTHLNAIIKNTTFFFVGNKNLYRESLGKKKNFLKNEYKKLQIINQLLAKGSWINLPIDFKNLDHFFKYLNKKDINLDFIYCSDLERKNKIGEVKYLKKNTMKMVISSERIKNENQKLLNSMDKIIENSHTITYKPREKFNKASSTLEFKKWHKNLKKLIFVSDEVLIYDRYIFKNFINVKNDRTIYNRNSDAFCRTLSFVSNSFIKSFVSKNDFDCKLICVLPPDEKYNNLHNTIKSEDNWEFLKKEMINFIKLNPTKTSITVKDWKLWNKVHERYWRFYKGGQVIKVLKFNPGFDFIKEMNFDWNKDKEYEFDNVNSLDFYKKEEKFNQLLQSKNVLFEEKSA